MIVSCHSDAGPSPDGDDDSCECAEMSERLLTKRDAAERLKVSVRTIDRLRAKDELRFVTVGRQVRFRPVDLDSFITKQVEGGRPEMGA